MLKTIFSKPERILGCALREFIQQGAIFGETKMNLSAPTMVVFLISVAVAILGLLGYYAGIGMPLANFHIMLIAWIVLAAGVLMKGI